MDKKEMKQEGCRQVDILQPVIYEIADYLHAHPELGKQEVLASSKLRHILSDYQFQVEDCVPEAFPTAFHASYGHGPLPTRRKSPQMQWLRPHS